LDSTTSVIAKPKAWTILFADEISPQQFEESWKANCFGAFLGAQQVLPAMVEQGRGTILLTGATAALRGGARFLTG
jgi:NAD(P)-dependent dehydrogenase (short-subunit alcohol dehydrogenase family)